jgi:UDP-N-acetylmuramoyl-tripeptide--D-alanyl-D-alanine ligase
MRFTREEIARAVGGRLSGQDGFVVGVSTDSRSIGVGSLFVPIVAERDGHDFIDGALARGAAAFLTQHHDEREGAIEVADTLEALRLLGGAARSRIPGPVIGITGSSGKTSTKDLLAAILRGERPTAASEKSFNNEIGVPLTLCNAPDDADRAVIEMGARGVGHIAELCAVARPTIGVITNIGTAHRELFETSEATARAKAELLESLPATGTAVLNLDDEQYDLLRSRSACTVLRFSATGNVDADLVATNVVLDERLRAVFVARTPWGSADVRLSTSGAHQVANALAAIGAACSAGASLDAAVRGCAEATLSPWRMEVSEHPGVTVINDAYNANPSSMRAALDSLAALEGVGRRLAVLGTMAELGPDADRYHREIAEHATALGVTVLAVDEPRYGAPVVHGIDAALAALVAGEPALAGPSPAGPTVRVAILVKGSRVAGLERLALALNERLGGTP